MKYSPLAAAWMSENFGMRFMDQDGLIFRDAYEILHVCYINHDYEGSIHLYSDDAHLLNPKIGDLVYDDEKVYWCEGRIKNDDRLVIQRNSTSFMLPE